jgi:hypothetical protein
MLGRQLFELGPRNKQYVCHEKPMAVLATATRNETIGKGQTLLHICAIEKPMVNVATAY